MGFGVAYLITQRSHSLSRRVTIAALFATLAWAAHFVWNSPWLDSLMARSAGEFTLALVIKGVPFLFFLLLLAVVARHREGKAFSRLIATEVGTDVLSENEFHILQSGRKRRAAVRRIKKEKGADARSLFKRLQREQMNLALFHAKVESGDHPALEAQRETIRVLKARLAALP
jgi:hypothetical protein